MNAKWNCGRRPCRVAQTCLKIQMSVIATRVVNIAVGANFCTNVEFVGRNMPALIARFWAIRATKGHLPMAIFVPLTFAFVGHASANVSTIHPTTASPIVEMPAGINGASDNKVISPVDPVFLARALQGYDQGKASYLVNGFTEGFKFHFQGEPSHEFCNNLVSAKDMPEIVDDKLAKEIQAGRIAGPFPNPPFSTFHLSPLGVVPKKESNKFRLIHHLSFPEGSSINDGIHEEFTSVQYQTIQDAISFLKRTPTPFMAKSDIESAFRIIPIHPSQHHLLGFHWKGQFYFDKCLPMGLAESCRIFEMFSSAIEWIMYQRGRTSAIVKVLDDFLFIEPSYEKCLSSLQDFQLLCSQLGVPLATEKTFGPDKILPFLGITLDAIVMESRLPQDKLSKCKALCHDFKCRKKVTLKELQSLIGTLQFATSVVIPGRPFLRRMIDLTKGIKKSGHKIRLNAGGRADMALWAEFLDKFNGKNFFLSDIWETSETIQLFTDASASIGFGAVFKDEWLYGVWAPNITKPHINALELYPIVAAIYTWGHQVENTAIWLFTDNMSLVSVLNSQSSRDPVIMTMVRALVLKCLHHNILIKAQHIEGRKNILADALSRLQIKRFKELLPSANPQPTPVHPQVDQTLFFPLCQPS
ncbi:uncharacterized protein [Argopecten irradians]|uniref:uncharacterized protein isoform X1 n=1 Tax=Argopecten irradians TaxID=31199 RepID=UPI003719297C